MRKLWEKLQTKYPELFKLVKFGLVGGVNTLIDWIVFSLLSLIGFFGTAFWLTKAISYSCGLLNSFFMNRTFTFQSNVRLISWRGLRFIAVNLAVYGISVLLIDFMSARFGLSGTVGNMAVTPVTVVLNFVLSRLFVFNGKGGDGAHAEKNQ